MSQTTVTVHASAFLRLGIRAGCFLAISAILSIIADQIQAEHVI